MLWGHHVADLFHGRVLIERVQLQLVGRVARSAKIIESAYGGSGSVRLAQPTRFLRAACRVDFASSRCSVCVAPRLLSAVFVALNTLQNHESTQQKPNPRRLLRTFVAVWSAIQHKRRAAQSRNRQRTTSAK